MNDTCDNRFEIIAKAKEELLKYTNISSSPDEMAVIDNILFRCWQMGWLNMFDEKYELAYNHLNDEKRLIDQIQFMNYKLDYYEKKEN